MMVLICSCHVWSLLLDWMDVVSNALRVLGDEDVSAHILLSGAVSRSGFGMIYRRDAEELPSSR